MHKKRLELKYSLSPEKAEATVFLPMLAHPFDKIKKIIYPVHEQPKLNGVRCLAHWKGNSIQLLSRGGKSYPIEHLEKQIASFLPKNLVLDGEIYLHGISFQAVTRLVKKYRPGETEKLQLWVYDVFEEDKTDTPWLERSDNLVRMFCKRLPDSVVPVQYMVANDEAEVMQIQKDYVEEGFEGGIVRLLDGEYELGHRSRNLLKVKTFQDAEFEIIGYKSGDGKFSDCVIWVCKTKGGEEFAVVPKGTLEHKRQLLKEAKKYVGEMLTVRYFDLFESGEPQFPVGLGIKAEEDR